jgi:hypothetical protein
MKKIFWFKICPFCRQGRLFIYRKLNKDQLYFHCEECEREYYHPENIDMEHAVLNLSEDKTTIEATEADLNRFGWGKYEFKFIEE